MDRNYTPPATPMAEAIQYPMDANWPDRIINAYAKMARAAREKKNATN